MRTIVFGNKGQLGRDIVVLFSEKGAVTGYDLPELDIANTDAVRAILAKDQPDLIINAAAYTDVEGAEDDEAAAFRVNETGAAVLAECAAVGNVPIVYYSTDYVFGGTKTTPYQVDDAIAPIGVYARSKAAGEVAVRNANPHHFIIRTAWLYGLGKSGFPEKMLKFAATRPKLKVVNDQEGSPTHTFDLAEATLALTKTDAYGTYHGVNGGSCSWYDLARMTLKLAQVTTPIEPCSTADMPTKAKRPLYSVLDTSTLTTACGYAFRSWQQALEHYMKRREPSHD